MAISLLNRGERKKKKLNCDNLIAEIGGGKNIVVSGSL